jgi:hypothetical protein
MTNPGVKAQIVERMEKIAIPPAAPHGFFWVWKTVLLSPLTG